MHSHISDHFYYLFQLWLAEVQATLTGSCCQIQIKSLFAFKAKFFPPRLQHFFKLFYSALSFQGGAPSVASAVAEHLRVWIQYYLTISNNYKSNNMFTEYRLCGCRQGVFSVHEKKWRCESGQSCMKALRGNLSGAELPKSAVFMRVCREHGVYLGKMWVNGCLCPPCVNNSSNERLLCVSEGSLWLADQASASESFTCFFFCFYRR